MEEFIFVTDQAEASPKHCIRISVRHISEVRPIGSQMDDGGCRPAFLTRGLRHGHAGLPCGASVIDWTAALLRNGSAHIACAITQFER